MPRKPVVVSSWHQLYENFSTSSRDFYAALESGIRKRNLPDVRCSRVLWKESGILSAKREYLRVSHGNLHLDVCAAPFGTGFFFSSRLAHLPKKLAGLLYLLIFLALTYFFKPFESNEHDNLHVPFRLWFLFWQVLPIVTPLFLVACPLEIESGYKL